jgi:hypothetical protein
MAALKLERTLWEEFCRVVSQRFAAEPHEIEIVQARDGGGVMDDMNGEWCDAGSDDWNEDGSGYGSGANGHGHGAWRLAVNIDCDADNQVLNLVSEHDCLTLLPHELYADLSERGLEGMCILDREGDWYVVLLRHPLRLTPARLTAQHQRAAAQPANAPN